MGIAAKRKILDYIILRNGRLKCQREIKEQNPVEKSQDETLEEDDDTLKMRNLIGPFYLVILGLFFGFCVFVFEFFTPKLPIHPIRYLINVITT